MVVVIPHHTLSEASQRLHLQQESLSIYLCSEWMDGWMNRYIFKTLTLCSCLSEWGLLFDLGILGVHVVLNVSVSYATVCILKGQKLGIIDPFLIWYDNYLFCLFHNVICQHLLSVILSQTADCT